MKTSNVLARLGAAIVVATPAVAFAQGLITLSPVQAAPALGQSMLIALVLVLFAAAVKFLPPAATRKAGALVVVAGVLAVVGAHAIPATFYVTGENCQKPVTINFSPNDHVTESVVSECPNLIQVTALVDGCEEGETLGTPRSISLPYCQLGMVLANGDGCRIPLCN